MEIFARSEAGDDGRLQSRRPGAGATENAGLPRPLALGVLASRLEEAAQAIPGSRPEAGAPD